MRQLISLYRPALTELKSGLHSSADWFCIWHMMCVCISLRCCCGCWHTLEAGSTASLWLSLVSVYFRIELVISGSQRWLIMTVTDRAVLPNISELQQPLMHRPTGQTCPIFFCFVYSMADDLIARPMLLLYDVILICSLRINPNSLQ